MIFNRRNAESDSNVVEKETACEDDEIQDAFALIEMILFCMFSSCFFLVLLQKLSDYCKVVY